MSENEAVTFSMILVQLVSAEAEKLGLSQKQFLEDAGLTQSMWSRLSRGKAIFTIEDLRASASVIGVKTSKLIAEAEKIAEKLPKQDVMVLDGLPPKPVLVDEAVTEEKLSGGAAIATTILAGAALAFLISRLMKK